MEYICHKRFKGIGASGKEYLIRRKEKLQSVGRFISLGAEAVCVPSSENAYKYFARNDDGNGLRRGELTYRIAYSPRHPNKDNGFRFTDAEVEMLETEYAHFLRQDTDTLIFNYGFFNAEIEELEELAKRLEVI